MACVRHMSKGLTRVLHLNKRCPLHKSVRTILSDAYYCKDVWSKRLHSPLLQNVNIEEFALKLQDKFDKDGVVTAVDADVFANKLEQVPKLQLDFAQSLLYRFRHTSGSVEALPSTSHAIIRALLDLGEHDRLREILADKINYGVFLDYHTANMLMDTYLKQEKYQEAAEVAYDLMLQEDFDHPLTHALAWYACHLRWCHGDVTAATDPTQTEAGAEEAEEGEDSDAEDEYVVVRFIENPWYDGHFDLTTERLRLGKTMCMLSAANDSILGRSYTLIGRGLAEQFSRGLEELEEWAESGLEGAVCQQALDEFSWLLEALTPREPPAEPVEAGRRRLEDVMPYVTPGDKEDLTARLTAVSAQLTEAGQVTSDLDLEGGVSALVSAAAQQCSAEDAAEQAAVYGEWEAARGALVEGQVAKVGRASRAAALARRLAQLSSTEERLRYFQHQKRLGASVTRGKKQQDLDDLFATEEFRHWAPRT